MDENSRKQLPRTLAANLLQLRQRKGYSQQTLARLAQIPRSTLAHMESGSGNPSLERLIRVAGALHVSIEELLSPPRAAVSLLRAEDIPAEIGGQGEIRVDRLLPESIHGLEIVRISLQPGATRVGHPHLRDTREFLHGLKGRMSVLVAGELHQVEAGDVLAFPGDQAHSYLNRDRQPCQALSIVVPVPLGY